MIKEYKFSFNISEPSFTPEGYMDADARLFRPHIREYENGDYKEFTEDQIREYGKTIEGKPIIVYHQTLDSSNAVDKTVGTVLSSWIEESDNPIYLWVRARILDKDTIDLLKETGQKSISVGINSYLDDNQREFLEFNHIALLFGEQPYFPEAQLFFSKDPPIDKENKTVKQDNKQRGKIMAKRVFSRHKFDESLEIADDLKSLEDTIETVDEIAVSVEDDSLQNKLQNLVKEMMTALQSLIEKQEDMGNTQEEEIIFSYHAGQDGIKANFDKGVKNIDSIREAHKKFYREKARFFGFSEDANPDFIRGAIFAQEQSSKTPEIKKEETSFAYGKNPQDKPKREIKFISMWKA